ncbi:hypothetical protein CP532_0883, partial [Ophiocordyceps camponoti-leonardi (nom. inval.)]
LLYCGIYVLPLHCLWSTRLLPSRSRDDPQLIQARVRAVSFSTTACSLITYLILRHLSIMTGTELSSGSTYPIVVSRSALHLMGYWPPGILETAKASLLTALLFAGPIYERLFFEGLWKQWLQLRPLTLLWEDWPTWRNIIAGPITEECLFRSSSIPLLLHTNAKLSSIIFRSPLVFGIAHLHHFLEFRTSYPNTPLVSAIARSAFQLSYTAIFGVYATFVFLRTGSLLATICVHLICNSLGLPRLWGAVEPYWLIRYDSNCCPERIIWTVSYYIILAGGILLWWSNLFSLTLSFEALVTF